MADRALIEELRSRIDAVQADPACTLGSYEPDDQGVADAVRDQSPLEDTKGAKDPRVAKEPKDPFEKIVALINASEKSKKTLLERLQKDGFDLEESQKAIAKAESYGLIDDERYATILIRSRISQGKGSHGIERELLANDIDPYSIEGWPDSYDVSYDSELERALDLLERKPPHTKNLREGAFRKVVSKGFPILVASTAARMWSEERIGS